MGPKLRHCTRHVSFILLQEFVQKTRAFLSNVCFFGSHIAAAVLLALSPGCNAQNEFKQLEEQEASRRLSESLESPQPPFKLLRHGLHASGSEFWIIVADSELKLPSIAQGQRPAACPADSVYAFAVSLGVSAEMIEPADSITMPAGSTKTPPEGSLWQWQKDGFSLRMRQVPLKHGKLAVVEKLPENP